MMIHRTKLALAVLMLLACGGTSHARPVDERVTRSSDAATAPVERGASKSRMEVFGKLPLSFEENRGQSSAHVDFLARGNGYTVALTAMESVFSLRKPAQSSEVAAGQGDVLRMQLVGANPDAKPTAQSTLPGTVNYFLGNDPGQWRTHIPTYEKILYSEVYPGIDLVYYGNQRQLEHDFIVSPGAKPESISLAFVGADKIMIDESGDLLLQFREGELRLPRPIVFQENNGTRRKVDGNYVLSSNDLVAFAVGEYDRSQALIIDPVVLYSTYLGGNGTDEGWDITVDARSYTYATGRTSSTDFPTTVGSFQTMNGGTFDAVVTKLNPTGTALVYSTYIGGTSDDQATGIRVDESGNAFITGITSSTDFPLTGSAFQSARSGINDGVVLELNASGTTLLYSSLFGGNGQDQPIAIAIDGSGGAYINGLTTSTTLPVSAGVLQTAFQGGAEDTFVAKFDTTQSGAASRVYSTYLGGNCLDRAAGIEVDDLGHVYVTGRTDSSTWPVTGSAYQSTNSGGGFGNCALGVSAFMTKLNPTGSAAAYSTYLGGSTGTTLGGGIDIDDSIAYVVGYTTATNLPTVSPLQAANAGSNDVFIAQFDTTLSGAASLVYSTYLGGTGSDVGSGIIVDSVGRVDLVGTTDSTNFPTAGATQAMSGGGNDAFVAQVDVTAGISGLLFGTYLGGTGSEAGTGPRVTVTPGCDANCTIYVVGTTASADFPVTAGVVQAMYGTGATDAFVTRFGPPDAECAPEPIEGCVAPTKGLLKLRGNTDLSKQKLGFKRAGGTALLNDFGDPVTGTTNYALCIYDDDTLVANSGIAAGGTCDSKPCWATAGSSGLKYKNKAGNAEGITQVKFKAGVGKAQVQVKGKGSGLSLPFPITDAIAVTAQVIKNPAAGAECWEAELPTPAKLNDSMNLKFLDKIP